MIKRNCIALLLCLVVSQLYAQVELEQTIVTASKYPQKQSQMTRTVDVLSDSLILANRNLSLTQLLSQRAGVQVLGNSQTPGSIQTLNVRGAGAAYTLVLLDGVPVNDPSSIDGNFDLNFLELESIERIEILKGGQSTLYGSNAVAGVINIISKKESSKMFTPSLGVSAGSFNSLNVNVGVRGALAGFSYDVNYKRSTSDGFSSADGSMDDLEDDGFSRDILRWKVSQKVGALQLGVFGLYSKYDADIDGGAFIDDKDFVSFTRQNQLGAFLQWDREKNQLKINFTSNPVERVYTDDSTDVPASAFNKSSLATYGSRASFLDVYNSYQVTPNLNWLVGYELTTQVMEQTYESVSSFGPFVDAPIESDIAKMTNSSIYSSLHYSQDAFGLEAGVRANRHSVYDWNTSFTASAFVNLGKQQKFIASVGNSFRNPSLYQLFSPFGNEDLIPEESINMEIGWEFLNKGGGKDFGLTFFNRTITNGLFFQSLDVSPFGQYINLGTQRNYGVEAIARQKVGDLDLSGNYTFLHGFAYTEDASIDKTFNILRIPKHNFQLSATYQCNDQLSLNMQMEAQGKRNDRFYNANTFSTEDVELDAFVLLHTQVNYSMGRHLNVFLSGRNLTNTKYAEIYGFRSEPLNWKIGLFYR